MIEIRNLVHQYEKIDQEGKIIETVPAINHLDLEINPGDFVAILGHNGSGKSTLARHLNGILLPSEGKVLVDGMDTKQEELIWEIRKKVGMVFQNPDNQMVATIIEEEVGFGPENLCLPPEEIHKRVDQCLALMEMDHYQRKSTGHLSGGQKQRVVIAGALAMNPECLVLDEPTAMLDPIGRKEVIDALLQFKGTHRTTILLVTHYMEEAVQADRIIVMNQGKVVMDGTPQEIFSREEELEQYHLELPPVMKVASLLRKKGVALPDNITKEEELVEALCQLNWKK